MLIGAGPAELCEPVIKMVVRHPDQNSLELLPAIQNAAAGDAVQVTHSGAPFVEIAAARVSKAAALDRIARRWGIGPDRAAAIGDAHNDLEMLRWAGTALCPVNAITEVRALADRVLMSNVDDGVARYFEELVAARSGA